MIAVDNLSVRFGGAQRPVHVVREVGFSLTAGGAIGIVGESGCGKSTVLRCIAGLETGWTGSIRIDGEPVAARRTLAQMRRLQMVFQDPYGSLHPRHRIARALTEPLAAMSVPITPAGVTDALTQVGLAATFADRFPHQLSGGQRQRVAIARALMLAPPVLLLDEPTSALDVSVQAEILNLLSDLREQRGLTYIFVSHDLAVVAHMCDRILVMQDGVFVEDIGSDELRAHQVRHPYTELLLENSLL